MGKFYGEDSRNIKAEYLLQATPFFKDTRINFNKRLTPREFFERLYVNTSNETQKVSRENELFDKKIRDALRYADSEFSKVDLINICGYAGCGKTTRIRRLLWDLYGEAEFSDDIVDFEGENDVCEAYWDTLGGKICRDLEGGGGNLRSLESLRQFELKRFGDRTIASVETCLAEIRARSGALTADGVKGLLRARGADFSNVDGYVYFLLVLDFLWTLSAHIGRESELPSIIIFDNLDSISDGDQEKVFVTALKRFINDGNYFFYNNIDNGNSYTGRLISDVINNTKFLCFLTTRIVTLKALRELVPDMERVYGWTTLEMPEQYYNHAEIIRRRVEYYRQTEGANDSEMMRTLEQISAFAENAYRSTVFKNLFNGNFRYCVAALCKLVESYADTGLIDEFNELYRRRVILENEPAEGASGILVSMLCDYLKNSGVYADKLHLSECQPDGKLSLSRIVLTVLREKGGTCSFLDLLEMLSPFFEVEDICRVTYDLSEAKREVLRRMVLVDGKLPRDSKEFFNEQGIPFRKDNIDLSLYRDINICRSGLAYIDSIVPHFEFMLSRHKSENRFLTNSNYHPLFSRGSEDEIGCKDADQRYRFERKIDWVYQDVRDCCKNSIGFSRRVMEHFRMDQSTYINNSYFNYHTVGRDGSFGYRQSYESRLIFSHIGYIERYRRYLLRKYQQGGAAVAADMNRRLVERIARYIALYRDEELCFQTDPQNNAAHHLQQRIDAIREREYTDFTTGIEVF